MAQHGLIEDALRHLIAAGDYPSAVQLLAQHRHGLINEEQWRRLGRWISLFPREVVEGHPELLLSEAWIARSNARVLEIPPMLDRAEMLIAPVLSGSSESAQSVATAIGLGGELDCLRSYQSYWASDTQGIIYHAQRGLKTTPHGWWSARLVARLMLAGAYQTLGDERSAYAAIYDAMKEQPSQNIRFQTRLLVLACFSSGVEREAGSARNHLLGA
jgi:LuxR family maltose regulon positive regulatory protein